MPARAGSPGSSPGSTRQPASRCFGSPRKVLCGRRSHGSTGFLPAQAASVYSGALGVAFALVEAGYALDAPALVDEGMGVAARIAQAPAEDAPLDVVGGSAGAIGAFLAFHARDGLGDFVGAAVRHGDHLLANAKPGAHGCSWDTLPGIAQEHLTGFAHGAAGIAWALLELFTATGEARFAKGAEEGFAYEEAWYSLEHENWPDLRSHAGSAQAPGAQPLVYNLAWCHGAPGIGFSRLRAFALSGAPRRRAEAETAVRTTARRSATDATAAPRQLLAVPRVPRQRRPTARGRAGARRGACRALAGADRAGRGGALRETPCPGRAAFSAAARRRASCWASPASVSITCACTMPPASLPHCLLRLYLIASFPSGVLMYGAAQSRAQRESDAAGFGE